MTGQSVSQSVSVMWTSINHVSLTGLQVQGCLTSNRENKQSAQSCLMKTINTFRLYFVTNSHLLQTSRGNFPTNSGVVWCGVVCNIIIGWARDHLKCYISSQLRSNEVSPAGLALKIIISNSLINLPNFKMRNSHLT